MKRTSVMLNEEILETATRLLGAKSYSEAINRALEESIRLHHIRGLDDLMGSGIWKGELSEMRRDEPERRRK